jgi:hypothetical protein
MTRREALSLTGSVRWANRVRGLVMFRPDRHDASDALVHLKHQAVVRGDEYDDIFRSLLCPGAPVTVRFAWQPEVDLLAPWQPQELICENGERLAAVPEPTRGEAHLPRAFRAARERKREDESQEAVRIYRRSSRARR